MERRRVFVVGDSLFAETLVKLLASDERVELIGWAPTADAALLQIRAICPDALILACENEPPSELVGRFLTADPGLPLILAHLNENRILVFTSRYIGTRTSDLFAAIEVLPKR
jgi:hypothetical protein